jgi:hypothetical protein
MRGVLLGSLGIVLLGGWLAETASRRMIQRRFGVVLEGRRQLERQLTEMLASLERTQAEARRERQRAQGLSEALLSARAHMEEAVGRLAAEQQTVRELRVRMTAMDEHMNQLQSQLAVSLQDTPSLASGAEWSAVQLDRIVVSSADAPALQGRVVSVHPEWNFVVLDLGWSTVKIGETVSIVRGDKLLAKARIERVQEGVCAATVLPEWPMAEVHVNDVARIL